MYKRIHIDHTLYMKYAVLLVFFGVFTTHTFTFRWFHIYTRLRIKHTLYVKYTVLIVFSCVSSAETCIFGMFHMHTRIHMNNTLYVKCTVASNFMCFYCVLTAQTCTFRSFNMYTGLQLYHTYNMKCSVLLVFPCVAAVETCSCFNIFHLYIYTHVPYIKLEMHCFASVSMCFFLQKIFLFVYFTSLKEYICTILYTWNALFFCYFSCVFTVLSLQKQSICIHCRNIYFSYISHVYKNSHEPYLITT
jgi:hypothetical protein